MSRQGSLALLLALTGCASAPASSTVGITVEVEGVAPADGSSAGDRALADAQKRAVEKALGVSIAASTKVEAAIAVRRRIWADARGRVESWTVLGDRVEGGMRLLRIRAIVRRLADSEEIPPPVPTAVRIEAAGPVRTGLRRGLAARGFTVVEQGGDFVVRAIVDAEVLRDGRTAPFVSGRGRVSVSVVETATGGVVLEQAREAAELDGDAMTASSRAVESAGELCGREAADGLSKILWNR
jgi:hypothetical protein